MNDGLKDAHRQIVIDILSTNPRVGRVVLFGSRATGTFTSSSDVDLALFGNALTLDDQAKLAERINDSSMPQQVDLLLHHRIKNRKLLDHIKRHGVEWFCRRHTIKSEKKLGMAGKWPQFRLGELCSLITDGKHGDCENDANSGFYFLSVKDVIDGRLVYDNARQIKNGDFLETHRRTNLEPGDVLFTNTGTIGRMAIARDEPKTYRTTFQKSVAILKPKRDIIDPHFLYYLLHYDNAKLSDFAAGTTQKNLLLKDLRDFAVHVPSLSEQKAIAHILGTLDDKIELNRRMNETLESMAQAIFKSWFVDFDPVRAKAEGRPTGLPKPVADLFPDSFQDSELGKIPKGWRVGKMGDLATLNRGAVNPGDFPTETFDHFSLPAFDEGRTPKIELGSAIMSNKFTVMPNSVLLSKLNPHIPRIWLPDLHATRRSVCSTEFMVACSKPGVSREYLFSLFTSSTFASIYGTLVTGTTGSHQRIKPQSVLDMKIVIPLAALVRAFTDSAKPMFDRINRNTEQSRTLAALRDTLLPKLLSGEIRVGDAEKTIEETV